MSGQRPCVVCANPTSKNCVVCKSAPFCSDECERSGFALHRLQCQPPADAANVLAKAAQLSFVDTPNHKCAVVAINDIPPNSIVLVEQPMCGVSSFVKPDARSPSGLVAAQGFDTSKVKPLAPKQSAADAIANILVDEHKLATSSLKTNAYLPRKTGTLAERVANAHFSVFCPFTGRTVAHMFYSLGRWFNHDCSPNARWIINGGMNLVVVTGPEVIKAGEEVTISYVFDYVANSCVKRRNATMREAEHLDQSCWCDRCRRELPEHDEPGCKDCALAKSRYVANRLSTVFTAFAKHPRGAINPDTGVTFLLESFLTDMQTNGEALVKTEDRLRFTAGFFASAIGPEAVLASAEKCKSDALRQRAIGVFKQLADGVAKHTLPTFTPRPQYFELLALALEKPDDDDEHASRVRRLLDHWAVEVTTTFGLANEGPFNMVLAVFGPLVSKPLVDVVSKMIEAESADANAEA